MIKYQFTKKDFKKYLIQKRKKTNIIFLIFGSLLYFYITFYLILENPIENLLFYGLYLIVMIILIFIFNQLYCFINIRKNNICGNYQVDIKEDKIIVNINEKKYEYLNKNIKKIIKKKNYIQIKYTNKISLLFIKNILDSNDYQNIEKFLVVR